MPRAGALREVDEAVAIDLGGFREERVAALGGPAGRLVGELAPLAVRAGPPSDGGWRAGRNRCSRCGAAKARPFSSARGGRLPASRDAAEEHGVGLEDVEALLLDQESVLVEPPVQLAAGEGNRRAPAELGERRVVVAVERLLDPGHVAGLDGACERGPRCPRPHFGGAPGRSEKWKPWFASTISARSGPTASRARSMTATSSRQSG